MAHDQTDQLIKQLVAAFSQETDAFLRFTLAANLVRSTQEHAQDIWIAELQLILTDTDALYNDFNKMKPFSDNGDLEGYILTLLSKAHPDVLAKNLDSLIEALSNLLELRQVEYFRAIFTILFREQITVDQLTPTHKKVLLTAANIVERDPGYLNRINVFWMYGLPHDAHALSDFAK